MLMMVIYDLVVGEYLSLTKAVVAIKILQLPL